MIKEYPKVSIIIPLYIASERFFSDLLHYRNLDYPDYEILIGSDKLLYLNLPEFKVILTGQEHTGPAEKRDAALKEAKGDILAFIDDDAYPRHDWLRNAIKYFEDPSAGAVGGPGITPEEDGFWERAGGAIYESFLGSGSYQYRFLPDKIKEVDDYPAYNLLVRKDLLTKIGGFKSTFYGGEDTKLCLEIIKTHRIIYAPDVIVFHHRRKLFYGHLKQINNIGIHRGYFVKAYPRTSKRFIYFIPSLVLLFSISILILSLFFLKIAMLSTLGLIVALLLIVSSIYRQKRDFALSVIASIGLITHHIAYGYGFFRGLFTKKLER